MTRTRKPRSAGDAARLPNVASADTGCNDTSLEQIATNFNLQVAIGASAAARKADGATLVITARLTGSDTDAAEGISVTGASPVLALCRELMRIGYDLARREIRFVPARREIRFVGDPALPLHAYIGFRPSAKLGTGPSMRFPGRAGVGHRAGREATP